MTSDDAKEFEEIREILRDVSLHTRATSRRVDGLATRVDHVADVVGAVQLQTSLTNASVLRMESQLKGLNTAAWDETTRTVGRWKTRSRALGQFVRKRGVAFVLALLAGGGVLKLIEALVS